MTDESTEQRIQHEINAAQLTVGQAAVTRHYASIGRGMEMLREHIGRTRKAEVFVYAINIRWPKAQSPQFFALVKAYTPEGPVVAFHGGYQLIGMLISLGERIDAEAMDWIPDTYPPEGWENELAYMHSQELNR